MLRVRSYIDWIREKALVYKRIRYHAYEFRLFSRYGLESPVRPGEILTRYQTKGYSMGSYHVRFKCRTHDS